MRPVDKWAVGHTLPDGTTITELYTPYGTAIAPLIANLGDYCSYCEVFSSDLEIEHIISQDQNSTLSTQWNNFLPSCGRCNGKDNKSNKPVNVAALYFPHLHNTFLAVEYLQGGIVRVNSAFALGTIQRTKAQATIDLLGLDKYLGNPKYPSGFPPRDKRWEHRRTAWILAQLKLRDYTAGSINAPDIAAFAAQRGFFSIWLTVFAAHIDVKRALINTFAGTSTACFDVLLNPISRNPTNVTDTL